jgi:hypothetical protein
MMENVNMMNDLTIRKLEETIFVNTLKAARNPENLLEDGTPNWNFVDADAYMDTINDTRYERADVEEHFYTLFDGVCFAVDKALEAA